MDTDHKAESSLEVDVTDATVAFEEFLHVPLPCGRVQTADEDTRATATHLSTEQGNVILH